MVPDFTNPETVRSWFAKRQYLLDIGVDGFKTDGGEFIHAPDTLFHDGSTGLEGKNRYPQIYTAAYGRFSGPERVLFSRAGYAGQHTTPILWAGDQQAQNSELKAALTAGLSAALTGIPFWGFDIGGFAGPLPTPNLYLRATQLACFCPVMQWHSEPPEGQFRELMPGAEGNNERSPWNMVETAGDVAYLDKIRFWHNLRMNLLPYIYASAIESATSGKPMMRPLVYEWPEDKNVIDLEDEFLLGEGMLVAPLLEEHARSRRVYLPAGKWVDFFSRETLSGGQWVNMAHGGHVAVYQRCGCGVALNLDESLALGGNVGNSTERYSRLHFLLAGPHGTMTFSDNLGSDLRLDWKDGGITEKGKAASPYSWELI
jgi:alpha-D-xyloside xylohydrolase